MKKPVRFSLHAKQRDDRFTDQESVNRDPHPSWRRCQLNKGGSYATR
jgi:hypothetical protein